MSNLDQQIVLDEMFPGDTSKACKIWQSCYLLPGENSQILIPWEIFVDRLVFCSKLEDKTLSGLMTDKMHNLPSLNALVGENECLHISFYRNAIIGSVEVLWLLLLGYLWFLFDILIFPHCPKAVCVVLQERGAGFGEVLSRHVGDALVCNISLENASHPY